MGYITSSLSGMLQVDPVTPASRSPLASRRPERRHPKRVGLRRGYQPPDINGGWDLEKSLGYPSISSIFKRQSQENHGKSW